MNNLMLMACASQNIGESIPDILVAGAGTTAVNGTCSYVAMSNGKPQYSLDGGALGDYIEWNGSIWIIYNGYTTMYSSSDDVATPDLVTTWVQGSGDLPLPTVTEV